MTTQRTVRCDICNAERTFIIYGDESEKQTIDNIVAIRGWEIVSVSVTRWERIPCGYLVCDSCIGKVEGNKLKNLLIKTYNYIKGLGRV